VHVAASTRCYSELSLKESLGKLADLEFSASEIVIGKKAETKFFPEDDEAETFENYVLLFRASRRVAPTAIYLDIEPDDPEFMERFRFTCELAKTVKVVQITIRSSLLGTPFNEEVERLRQLTQMAVLDGLIIGVATEQKRMSEDQDSLRSFCKSVRDLTITLDPSHFIFGLPKPREFDAILEYVTHVRMRDTTKDKFQIQVGQGIQEYSRFVIQLEKVNYRGALCVDLAELPKLNHDAEMRKMRLLLESLL
jgi:sugar phosphate isomerase/epimerase